MQLEFQRTARDFARKELLPHASHWDETKHFPVDTLRAAARLGFGGLYIRYREIGVNSVSDSINSCQW